MLGRVSEHPGTSCDLAFLGPVYVDLVMTGFDALPVLGSEVHATAMHLSPGGTATRAVAAARLGARTALLSLAGHDLFGDRLVADLRQLAPAGLDLTGLVRSDATPTPVSVAVVAGGDRTFLTYEQPRWASPVQLPDWRATPRSLHLDVSDPVPAWVSGLRSAGTELVGGVGYVDDAGWGERLRRHLADVDVFVPNDDEAQRATGTPTPEAAAAALAEHVGVAVVTRGARGAVAAGAQGWVEVDGAGPEVLGSLAAEPVVDTTGAGDVFAAALMAGGLEGWSLTQRVEAAVLCSGLAVRRPGGASGAPDAAALRTWWDAAPAEGRRRLAHLEAWVTRGA